MSEKHERNQQNDFAEQCSEELNSAQQRLSTTRALPTGGCSWRRTGWQKSEVGEVLGVENMW